MNKTQMLVAAAAFTLLTTLTPSCKKATNAQRYQPLDFTAVNIGDRHNKFVLSAYERYAAARAGRRLTEDISERERQQLVVTQIIEQVSLMPVDPAPLGMTREAFQNTVIAANQELAAHDYDIRNYGEPPCNPVVYGYVVQILNQVDQLANYGEMTAAFDRIEADARSGVADYGQLDEILGILQIARASAYLWSDASGNFQNARTTGRGRKVLIADVSGSATFFARMGIMGAVLGSTPGANAAILGGWAISAGVSSAMAALVPHVVPVPVRPGDIPPVKKDFNL